MVDTTINCKCGYEFKIDLPDRVFDRGSLIVPCPECWRKYIVYKDGSNGLFERAPLRFLAMHY